MVHHQQFGTTQEAFRADCHQICMVHRQQATGAQEVFPLVHTWF